MQDELIIGIFACATLPNYRKEIYKINETWGITANQYNVRLLFFLGEEETDLKGEQYIYLKGVKNDVLSASYKQSLGLKYIFENYVSKYVMFCGTDTFIVIPKVLEYLKNFDYKEPFYIGGDSGYRQIGQQRLYYHSGGPGFILSQSCLSKLYPYLENFCMEWENICSQNDVEYLCVACDVAISYYVQLPEINARVVTHIDGFFACNHKGIARTIICCGNKVKIENIMSCHYMSLEDSDEFYQITKQLYNV
jgi:hypothetical protein